MLWHKIEGQPACRQINISNSQLDRAAQANKVSDRIRSIERQGTGSIR